MEASRFGTIPLGGDAEEPEYSTGSWVSTMLATGMGIGLIFYGVGEPLYFYTLSPPDTVDPQTARAVSTALGTAMFHWTIYPWAMYALVGSACSLGLADLLDTLRRHVHRPHLARPHHPAVRHRCRLGLHRHGGLSENGATDPSRFTVVFWGVATGGVASAMLLRHRWPTRSWSTRSPPRSRRPTSPMRSRPSSCTPGCRRPPATTMEMMRAPRTVPTRPPRT
ncbi:hypothetical protein BKH26_08140 [Actinomyces oris]|nr:hypothetical protein BKH26_08140 [Actinomyces oris]OLO62235.1 hypothetical protein BKH24_02600 [Actinomyces oris]